MGFFKTYDMRGTFGVDFDLDVVARVGEALPKVVGGRRWLVGRDVRKSSPAVHAALVSGLRRAGVEVTDLGLCTTSMVYFFTAMDGFDGSVMITASHNPPTDNGLKVSKRTALPVGYADGLNEVERIVRNGEFASLAPSGEIPETAEPSREHLARYIDWQRKATDDSAFATLRYAVDCSNGMSSILARELFPDAEFINDTLDGSFPCHSPNPLKAEAREQLASLVREKGLDFGVIFDGDADRCMFVDERGEFVQPDYLVPIVARATLRALPAEANGAKPRVIHDIRTSRGTIEAIAAMGCEPVAVPVGHAFAKPILRECGAICGGELAGHYYFKEFFGCDSGVLAARRIIAEIARAKASGETFSQFVAPISRKYANSGELNFRVEDKDGAIARVLDCAAASLPAEVSRSDMDGVRIEYAEGWINIRKSNTEPYLRLIAECDTPERLAEWIALLKRAIG